MPISEEAKKDLQWFMKYIKNYNGKSMMRPSVPTWTILADACPTGGGATDFRDYIDYTFPDRMREI